MTRCILAKLERRLVRAATHARRPVGLDGDISVEAADESRLREILRKRLADFNLTTTGIHAFWPTGFQVRDAEERFSPE